MLIGSHLIYFTIYCAHPILCRTVSFPWNWQEAREEQKRRGITGGGSSGASGSRSAIDSVRSQLRGTKISVLGSLLPRSIAEAHEARHAEVQLLYS